MVNVRILLAHIAAFSVLASAPAAAQALLTGSVAGVVRSSPDNLPFPGATITATSPASQGAHVAVTDQTGSFLIQGLAPGLYTIRVDVAGMAPAERPIQVLLGRESRLDLTIEAAAVTEGITVAAAPPPVLTETRGGLNLQYREIDRLPHERTVSAIALLAPGVNDSTPNAATGQIGVSGAFGYDSSFLVDGVEINDNVIGQPHRLFIEDAIQETQVLTSSIPAEYGRFSGGVVNAITQSGGDRFSGSFRVNFTNSAWSTETPFETSAGESREGDLNQTFEATFGGPISQDHLWFFGGWRKADTSTSAALPQTGLPFTREDKNDWLEVKLTASPRPAQTLQASYLRNHSVSDRTAFAFSIDPRTGDRYTYPNDQFAANYRGVLNSTMFAQVQYSQKRFKAEGVGGTSANLADSPFINFSSLGHYNAPYFDERDPEERNNRQLTGSLSFFLTSSRWGRHDFKAGFENFTSTRVGGNSQSSTGHVYWADYKTDGAGNPLFDQEGRLIPTFPFFGAFVDIFFPQLGAQLDITTTSFYIQDSWRPTARWTLNLGARFEHVGSEATGGSKGLSANTLVPRLAASYDLIGEGRVIVQGSYSHYAGKYTEAQFGANTNVGTPDEIFGIYVGPSGEGRDFAPGLNPENYLYFYGAFPTRNIFFDDDLHSPVTREFTLATGAQIGNSGYAKATYVRRRLYDAVEDFVTLAGGATHVVAHDIDFGDFPNIIYRNTDLAKRQYDALQLQGRYALSPRWSVAGTWTIEIKNDGNFEGEAVNRPGSPSVIGNYPELFSEARHYPGGRLDDFQRHRARVWSAYTWTTGRFGSIDVAAFWRINSARTYSLVAFSQGLTPIQEALGASYATLPEAQDVFFGERGSGRFKGYGLMDLSLTYQIPLLAGARPWLKIEVFNAFNNQKLIAWNTAVRPDPSSPADGLGLPTGYIQGSRFGQAQGPGSYPAPYAGATGGRTVQFAVGVRF